MKNNLRSRRKTGKTFNPTHTDLERAIGEFRQRGGQIQKIEKQPPTAAEILASQEERGADEFLLTELDGLRY